MQVKRYDSTWFEAEIDDTFGPVLLPAVQDGGGGDVCIRLTKVSTNGDLEVFSVVTSQKSAREFAEAWPALLAALEADRG